mmetsp:Transcript_17005/g.22115  ORF Transcript_17005/g.22115 Transcript_17005/m.22115 type:complete len:94 (+) Transcript_17005:1575-1856(+)
MSFGKTSAKSDLAEKLKSMKGLVLLARTRHCILASAIAISHLHFPFWTQSLWGSWLQAVPVAAVHPSFLLRAEHGESRSGRAYFSAKEVTAKP